MAIPIDISHSTNPYSAYYLKDGGKINEQFSSFQCFAKSLIISKWRVKSTKLLKENCSFVSVKLLSYTNIVPN